MIHLIVNHHYSNPQPYNNERKTLKEYIVYYSKV